MAKRRGRRTSSQRSAVSEHEVYERIASEPEFAELRRRYRRFAFPATVAFMVWYITYVVCNNWARDFMDTQVVGNINVALVFGLLQFASTFLIAYLYARHSTKKLDPLATKLQRRVRERRPADERPAAGPAGHREPFPHHRPVPRRRRRHPGHHFLGVAAEQDRGPVLRRRPVVQRLPERHGHQRRLHVRRLIPRHLRRRSPCTGTTASSTRSASWWPGWSPCCWSRSCCATRAATPWPTSWRTGCARRRYAPPRPPRPSWCRSSTCWPRWSAPAASSACCWGSPARASRPLVIVGVGVLMIIYVTLGGMKGTTWVQIVKAVLLMTGTLLITILVLAQFGFNLSELLGRGGRAVRQGHGVPGARTALRQGPDRQDRLPVPGPRPGAGHGRAAAHPDPVLHHPDGPGRAQVGALGDRTDRRLLPDDPRAGLRGGGAGRHGEGQPGDDLGRQRRVSAAGPGGGRGRGHPRRVDPAGADLGGGVRHHPRGGRRADPHLGFVRRPRPVRQRDQEGPGQREAGAGRGADRGVRHRRRSPSCWPSRRNG